MSYRKGYRAERKVVKYLKDKGFYVIRSAGSKGLFDVIAVKKGLILGIQVKKNYKLVYRDIAYKQMHHKLEEAYEEYGIIPLYATTEKGIKFYTYNGFEINIEKLKNLV